MKVVGSGRDSENYAEREGEEGVETYQVVGSGHDSEDDAEREGEEGVEMYHSSSALAGMRESKRNA